MSPFGWLIGRGFENWGQGDDWYVRDRGKDGEQRIYAGTVVQLEREIRNDALEEAAKVCEESCFTFPEGYADAIRALKTA